MTVAEAFGRIQQIQTTIGARLDQAPKAVSSTAGAAAAAVQSAAPTAGQGAAAFAQTLSAMGQANAAGAVGGQGVTGSQVSAAAQKYIGVPYVWGGTDPVRGMDCSGFVQRVYKDLGISLPRVVRDQMTQGTPVASLAEAKPGDLLVSFGGDHVAIYLGNGKAIDAPEPGKTIQIRDAWEKYSGLTAIRRIVPDTPSPSVGGIPAQSPAVQGKAPAGLSGGTGLAALDPSQRRYAQLIVDEVRSRGLPEQAAVNAISTALQESSLRMYWNPKVAGSQGLTPDQGAVGTDGYSVGLFQQQVNGGQFSWGTAAEAMDPRRSTGMFLDRLTAIPGWQSMPVAAADQAVQRSAYPDAYAMWESPSRQIVADLYGSPS